MEQRTACEVQHPAGTDVVSQPLDPPASATTQGDDLQEAAALLATGLRRALARRHGLHEPAGAASGVCGEIEWMSENATPMMDAPGGDAAPALSRAGLHKQGGPAGAANTDGA